ncbi:MAG: 3-isopropylmalate dehydratase small subunit [Candidatus Thermoplasmatota archaeon]|jgi:3-isopropylmalate/(R)-2-methylmalate dehydratase small subunit|nr:3-isopropylmalate dehydratase small subunit [Candidatus Thermoplasmatota archaeon]MCL5984297.1 3-isopropylmalate dehydratase small subunit [Candidatus Thermoplasmatota archaeon]
MNSLLRGKVWCLDDQVDTDQLIAGKYLTIIDPNELRKHVMEDLLPEFSKKAQPGDIIVAGENFGCGSSREHAPAALAAIGLGAVVANSFARIFYRNCINLGLAAIEVPDIRSHFRAGDIAEIHLSEGYVKNVTQGKEARFPPLPTHILEILDAGGLVNKVRKELGTA